MNVWIFILLGVGIIFGVINVVNIFRSQTGMGIVASIIGTVAAIVCVAMALDYAGVLT